MALNGLILLFYFLLAAPEYIKRRWMKIFEEISQDVESFAHADRLAIYLQIDHSDFERIRGEPVPPLDFQSTAKKIFDMWLEDHHRLAFEEKKAKFSEALDRELFPELNRAWKGQ